MGKPSSIQGLAGKLRRSASWFPATWLIKSGPVARIWKSPWIGVPLWLIAAYFTVRWYFAPPGVGKAIGTLAVVAGIMSVRDIEVIGKISWVVLLICMLVTEFRAIDKDGELRDRKQAEFFDSQKQGFDKTGEGLQTAINGLKTAISGIDKTLKTADKTLRQTQPHADIRYQNLAHIDRRGNVLNTPMSIATNEPYHMFVYYLNAGSETGVLVSVLGKAYAGIPLDQASQEEMHKTFEADWSSRKDKPPAAIAPGVPGFSDFSVGPFLPSDIADIQERRKTIYYFFRFAYRDKTGLWLSDYCTGMQIAGDFTGISLPCGVNNNPRYRAKRQ
jgi:hypothetical protein